MRTRLLSAVVLALFGTFAWGCGDDDDDAVLTDDGVVTFDDLDVSDDGFVGPSEWATVDDEWDLNGDHLLDEDEFLMGDDAFETFDLDDDGFVSGAEWASAFDEFDFDADGFLSADELF